MSGVQFQLLNKHALSKSRFGRSVESLGAKMVEWTVGSFKALFSSTAVVFVHFAPRVVVSHSDLITSALRRYYSRDN